MSGALTLTRIKRGTTTWKWKPRKPVFLQLVFAQPAHARIHANVYVAGRLFISPCRPLVRAHPCAPTNCRAAVPWHWHSKHDPKAVWGHKRRQSMSNTSTPPSPVCVAEAHKLKYVSHHRDRSDLATITTCNNCSSRTNLLNAVHPCGLVALALAAFMYISWFQLNKIQWGKRNTPIASSLHCSLTVTSLRDAHVGA